MEPWVLFGLTGEHAIFRGRKRESSSESRMRETRLSGSMSGMWKRSRVNLMRHRQTKEPGTDRGHLNHRATSRLYRLNPLEGVEASTRRCSMEIRSRIGIDLGKTIFHLVGLNARGEVVVRKKCFADSASALHIEPRECLIGMEACGGSHFLGRALREQGHDVRLMPAQYVKPYVKTNKNDYIDAEAIAEAVGRPTMRFVPIKTDDQLDLQSLHRVRERWVMRRTAVINQIRGLLLERGITMRKGRKHLEASLPRSWKTQRTSYPEPCGHF